MSHTKFVAVVLLLASAVVQANRCSSDGECPTAALQNGVSLLQTKLQTNVIEDTKEFDEKVVLEDRANLKSTLADSQLCRALHFEKTCQLSPGKLVILVSVNFQMIDFFLQWLASASEFIDKSCMHLRVMAEDEDAQGQLFQLNSANDWDLDIAMEHMPVSQIQFRGKPELPFDSSEYNKLVDRRSLYIQDLLKQGCTTFYVDIDTIWKKSPFVEILAKDKGQPDLYMISDDKDGGVIPSKNFCTCFMYINPTTTSLNIIGNWTQTLQERSQPNQNAFNKVLQEGDFGQQVIQLPYKKFPPGSSYSRFKEEACIAHANYLVGHEAKGRFLKAVADEKLLPVRQL